MGDEEKKGVDMTQKRKNRRHAAAVGAPLAPFVFFLRETFSMTTLCQSNGQQRKMWAWTFLPSLPFSARGIGGLRVLEVGVCRHRVSAEL